MIGFLIGLYPRAWRARYGDEFAALLEEGSLGPFVVLDVLRHAARLQVGVHRGLVLFASALALSASAEVAAVRMDLTNNILWPPTTPLRTLALAGAVPPWVPVESSRCFP